MAVEGPPTTFLPACPPFPHGQPQQFGAVAFGMPGSFPGIGQPMAQPAQGQPRSQAEAVQFAQLEAYQNAINQQAQQAFINQYQQQQQLQMPVGDQYAPTGPAPTSTSYFALTPGAYPAQRPAGMPPRPG